MERFKPNDAEELKLAINEYVRGIRTHGLMNDWDVSEITDMKFLFRDLATFNEPINNWDVSKVKKYGRYVLELHKF